MWMALWAVLGLSSGRSWTAAKASAVAMVSASVCSPVSFILTAQIHFVLVYSYLSIPIALLKSFIVVIRAGSILGILTECFSTLYRKIYLYAQTQKTQIRLCFLCFLISFHGLKKISSYVTLRNMSAFHSCAFFSLIPFPPALETFELFT